MNFFQKVMTGRLFSNRSKNGSENGISSFIESMPNVIIKFTIMERTYILEEFDINFSQEVNDKGLPGGLPKGGIMTLTISEAPDHNLNEWILRDTILRNGEIRFVTNERKIDGTILLDISFADAYCIGFEKKINPQNGGLFTILTISPRYIKVGNEDFENRWKADDRYTNKISLVHSR